MVINDWAITSDKGLFKITAERPNRILLNQCSLTDIADIVTKPWIIITIINLFLSLVDILPWQSKFY